MLVGVLVAASRRHSTACLSKQARRIYSLVTGTWGLRWGYGANGADDTGDRDAEEAEARSMHPMTLQWGAEIAADFTADEAAKVWRAFRPVDLVRGPGLRFGTLCPHA